MFHQTTGWPLALSVASRIQLGFVIVPWIEIACGVRALADYLTPLFLVALLCLKGSSSSRYSDGEIPQSARKFLSGQGADFLVSRDSKPSPSSQSATKLLQTDKQQKQLEPKQTDLGEAGEGVSPGVIQALGQAVVMVTTRPVYQQAAEPVL